LEALKVKVRGVVGGEARGEVVDDDGGIGVDDLAQQAAAQFRQAIALRPRIGVLGEARGAGDEVVGRLDVAAREGDVVFAGDELADAVPVGFDQLLRIGDAGDRAHRAVDDRQLALPGEAMDAHGGVSLRTGRLGATPVVNDRARAGASRR
jgi:hypothetical protein